jgi:hypothetical protein
MDLPSAGNEWTGHGYEFMSRTARRRCSVYFISSEDDDGYPVKIGVTSGFMEDRLSQMQCGNPHQLTCMTVFDGQAWMERKIHEWLDGTRVRGEWYSRSARLTKLMDAVRENGQSAFWWLVVGVDK